MIRVLLDTGIAELLYDWNPIVLFLCGIVIDIILFLLSNYKDNIHKKAIALLMVFVALTATGLTILTHSINICCSRIPQYFEDSNIPYSQGILILRQNCSLHCIEIFDHSAEEKINEGINLYSHRFIVKNCSPKPGTLVDKNTEISIYVSWNPEIIGDGTEKNETKDGQEIFVSKSLTKDNETKQNPYPDFDSRFCYPFNSNEFTLMVEEQAIKILTEGKEEWCLGLVPDTLIPIQIDLINFDSGITIDSKDAYLGDTVHFGNIPDGTYYYEIRGDGYTTGFSGSPFSLKYDNTKEKDNLPWITALEKINVNYNQAFKVKMFAASGNIVPYTKTAISVIGNNCHSNSEYPVYINENGFLTLWMGINDVDYYFIADFYVADGYMLTVSDSSNNFLEARSIINGICELEY